MGLQTPHVLLPEVIPGTGENNHRIVLDRGRARRYGETHALLEASTFGDRFGALCGGRESYRRDRQRVEHTEDCPAGWFGRSRAIICWRVLPEKRTSWSECAPGVSRAVNSEAWQRARAFVRAVVCARRFPGQIEFRYSAMERCDRVMFVYVRTMVAAFQFIRGATQRVVYVGVGARAPTLSSCAERPPPDPRKG
jgi:hypothetical protein